MSTIVTYPCTKCDFSAKTPGGLGTHSTRMHGKANSKRQKATKAAVVPVELPMERGEMIADEATVGIAAMLEVVFPHGIPFGKIGHATNWVLATEKLLDGLSVP